MLCVVLCCVVLCCAVLCCAVLCCAAVLCFVLCCVVVLQDTPDKILRYVVVQFSKVLPNNPAARKSFVQSGCLRIIQDLKADEKKNKLQEPIAAINACFNPEIILFYSPHYPRVCLYHTLTSPLPPTNALLLWLILFLISPYAGAAQEVGGR